MTTRMKFDKERRQKEAVLRNEAWQELSLESRLDILNLRPGNSLKQRKKITKQIEERDELQRVEEYRLRSKSQKKRNK